MARIKIFYPPGLFSLIGMPFFFYILSSFPNVTQRHNCLRIYLPRDGYQENPTTYSAYTIRQQLRGKHIHRINIGDVRPYRNTEPPYYNSILNNVALDLQKLQSNKDSDIVIKVVLDQQCNYKTFVWLFDQALINDIKRFPYLGDSIFFFSNASFYQVPENIVKRIAL